MGVGVLVVVAWPIQIRGHQADRIKAVLAPQRLAQRDACDLGDGVTRFGWLKCSCEQRLFPDRLLGEFRVDAAATQKQQTPHARAARCFDNMDLDLEVLQQEVRRVAAIGRDATHLRGGKNHHSGLVLGKPSFYRRLIEQANLTGAGRGQLVVTQAFEGASDGTAGHASVAGHKYAFNRCDQGFNAPPPAALIASGLVGGFSIEPTTCKPLRFR